MPSEAELLRAVTDHPDDDAPRLAFAAHAGGAREKFIRGQLAGAATGRAGKTDMTAPEMRALLGTNAHTWAGPIADRVHDYHFVRGFADWIVVDAQVFARDWQALVALAPIRHLDAAHAAAAAAAFFACPGLAQIVTLSLNVTGPEFDPPGSAIVAPLVASPHLAKLKLLDLRRCQLTDDDKAAIAKATNMPALECLLLDDLGEDLIEDWDGSVQDIRPSDALDEFETKFAITAPALHYAERNRRNAVRDYF